MCIVVDVDAVAGFEFWLCAVIVEIDGGDGASVDDVDEDGDVDDGGVADMIDAVVD